MMSRWSLIYRYLFHLAMIGGMLSCVTSRDTTQTEVVVVPRGFQASQVIKYSDGSVTQSLLAQIDFDASLNSIVLLEPLFQAPIVRLERKGDDYIEEWYVKKVDFPAETLVEIINEVYSRKSIILEEKQDIKYGHFIAFDKIRSPNKTCELPKRLQISFVTGQIVNVQTQAIDCED